MRQVTIAPKYGQFLYHFAVGDRQYFESVEKRRLLLTKIMASGECLQLISGESSTLVFDLL